MNYWFKHPLRYKFGASIRIDIHDDSEIDVFKNKYRVS